jgi:transposase InsO family protein
VKSKILAAIEGAMKTASREQCLEEIGLSLSRYKRWRRERRLCGFTGLKSCPRWIANQLTMNEVQVMRNLVTSKEFSHFPIRSLHYYAKREGILFCSYSTWQKYIHQFDWQRPRKVFPKNKRKVGIRAAHPNEIWHLDVSYFILSNKTKLFIQPIIDNYSRYVIAWQVLES